MRNLTSASITEPTEITSLRTKVTSPLPRWKDVTAFAEYEQDMEDFDRRMAAVGGESRSRTEPVLCAARVHYIAVRPSCAGYVPSGGIPRYSYLDMRYMQDDRVFSEYRIGDAPGERKCRSSRRPAKLPGRSPEAFAQHEPRTSRGIVGRPANY